ncbi:MAG: 3-deoxy-manno-octulosonate cytidylyltransferase [Rhodobacteraceae bacterium]|nr:3-deoxy-manno-octulosonate cytidylyltransferase [Paracoccaceae bacterium]
MSVLIIIPARYKSSRYPGKPLAVLKGADGEKTLIQRTWETACAVSGVDGIYVATDDDRIANTVKAFGGNVVMTSEACRNGTERCADAVTRLNATPEIVVNLQGDAPLTPPWFLEDLIAAMRDRPDVGVATPVLRCDAEAYARLREDRAAGRVGGTTAVFARNHEALFFSKEVIPFLPDPNVENPPVWHHVGVYAYRPNALAAYTDAPQGVHEVNEGLEQLRFLENGTPVLCVEVEARGRQFWELNNPVDVARIESVL